jgi:hypothetical protein
METNKNPKKKFLETLRDKNSSKKVMMPNKSSKARVKESNVKSIES